MPIFNRIFDSSENNLNLLNIKIGNEMSNRINKNLNSLTSKSKEKLSSLDQGNQFINKELKSCLNSNKKIN